MAVIPTYASPNIGNLYVGRGFLTMELQGENSFQDMGNVTVMTFQVQPTRLEHYSSRQGVRTKDLVVVTQLAATLKFTVEEMTARNMAIAMLAAQGATSGSVTIDALSQPLQYAALDFTGTNVVGPVWGYTFPLVLLSPEAPVSMISEGSGSWGTIAFEGDVLKDPISGQFFTAHASDFT